MKQTSQQVSDKGNKGSIEELLETEDYILSIKKNFGLTRERRLVCETCGNQNSQGKCENCGGEDIAARNVWVEKKNGIMNKRGVDNYVSTLRTFVDRNQITSNFSKGEIVSVMRDFHEKFAEEIFWEWENYGIQNKAQAHKVVTAGTNVVWALYKRAEGGDTLDSISGMGKDVQKSVQKQEEDKGSSGLGIPGLN